jgi:ribonuclease P protein component
VAVGKSGPRLLPLRAGLRAGKHAPARRRAWAEEAMGEADISTEQPQARQESWLPAPHVDAGRARHLEGTPPQGPAPAVGLNSRVWRIRDRTTFGLLRRDGRRTRSGAVTVTFVDGPLDQPPRVAYAAGRRVGGAVVRNQLRRRLRAIVSEVADRLRPGAYLISAAPPAADLTFGELRSTVIRALGVPEGPSSMTGPPSHAGSRP